MSHTTRRTDPAAAKRRDMTRSVLPSTRRHSAKVDLDAIRRRARRSQRQACRDLRNPTCSCISDPDRSCLRCDADAHVDYPLRDHRYAIRDRREADNVAALIRWGRHVVADLDADTARTAMRAALPPGAMGAHAYLHLEIAGVVDDPRPRWGWGARRLVRPDWEAVLRHLAHWVLASGHHRDFNTQGSQLLPVLVRGRWEPVATWPKLEGAHHVDDWVRAANRRTWGGGNVRMLRFAAARGWRSPEPLPETYRSMFT